MKLKWSCTFRHWILLDQTVPEECDVLAGNFLQVAERRGLAGEAVVGVVVRHDGGGADLAQLVLWALQTPPHSVQVVLPAIPHYKQRRRQNKEAGFTE